MGALKRLFLGRPLATEESQHQLLPKSLALPVFASDALSSVSYATEEILHVLILAGSVALMHSLPIAGGVVALMFIVITSYRQTVRAYPRGGGGYLVTRENVSTVAGLTAAGALLAAYVMTVAVSMAAGAFAVASFVPGLNRYRVSISILFLVIITVMNLRGAKESGALFAGPTYAFVLAILALIATGVTRCLTSGCPEAESSGLNVSPEQGLGLFLILRAFSSGATALTGVEAIADGVQAFKGRRPAQQANNAATTLGILLVLSTTMFVGITYLANRMHVHPVEHRSVVAQIAHATFGGGIGFAVVQITTVLILILAANTAYQDFPRLSSILARDRFMPRQFINRGDRLVFSNGVLVLAVLSAALIWLYDATVTRLIPLYLVGVFTTFTFAQAGMVARWLRLREAGWVVKATFNGIGAVTTGVVLCVVVVTRFTQGAWIMLVAIPLIVLMLLGINRHYASVARQLRLPEGRPARAVGTRAIVLVKRVDEATMRAVGYARAMRPIEVRGLHVGRGSDAELVNAAWTERRLSVPLDIIPGDSNDIIDPIRSYIRAGKTTPDEYITIVLPELYHRAGMAQFLRRRRTLFLKTALLFERQVVLTDIPVLASENWASARGPITPTRVIAVVLVSAVHNATLRALEYARALSPTDLRAVTFNVEPDETQRVVESWAGQVDDIPLEAVDSPYREVARPLVQYARKIRTRNPDAVVNVIIPEFIVRRLWHQALHNQTALSIKQVLLFEAGVVVTSVPFHLD